MKRLISIMASVVLAAMCVTHNASASLVLDLNTGGSPLNCGSCGNTNGDTFGWGFRVINPITIDGLGVWDSGADGLGVQGAPTGLWTATGTLLASATITDGSTQVTSASADGEWLFEDIALLTLQPGSYVIGTAFLGSAPLAQIGAPFTNIADIAVSGGVGDASLDDAGLTFPGVSFNEEVFGPTMRLAAVPIPTTVALLGLGLAGIGYQRRRITPAD